jgi:hypothetical protein
MNVWAGMLVLALPVLAYVIFGVCWMIRGRGRAI